MRSGALIVSAFCDGTNDNHEIEIYGERGSLRIDCYRTDGLERCNVGQISGGLGTRLRWLKQTALALPHLVGQARGSGDLMSSYAKQWRHFAGAITQNGSVECNLADGTRALEIALAAADFVKTNRVIAASPPHSAERLRLSVDLDQLNVSVEAAPRR
jgi:predicted dehydrogenase